jgi:hypothetical protein
MQQLETAESIMTKIGSDPTIPLSEYAKLKYEAMELYKKICFDSKAEINVRIEAFKSFMWCIPEDGLDAYRRLRDTIMFAVAQSVKDRLAHILKKVTLDIDVAGYINSRSRKIISHEILISAIQLYNLGELDVYDIFLKLIQDPKVPRGTKIEACKYAFANGDSQYRSVVTEFLSNVISSKIPEIEECMLHDDGCGCEQKKVYKPSKERYTILSDYFSKSGIQTAMNNNKIKIPYDEFFVSVLQRQFFNDEGNHRRERCLSGQHLLMMSEDAVSYDEKIKILDVLFSFATDATEEEQIRSDAADIVLRLGPSEYRSNALRLIKELGYSSVNKSASKIINRIKHIYNNSQNVHMIPDECVEEFCAKMMSDTSVVLRKFDDVVPEIVELTKNYVTESSKKFDILDSLNRISIDTATFSSFGLTSQELLVYVYERILAQEGDIRKTLEQIFTDELVDMSGWCSTGNAVRIILVLQLIEPILRFNFQEQIISNFSSRLANRIETLTDETLRDKIGIGMLPGADEEDAKAFRTYFDEMSLELHDELHNEFVKSGHVSDAEFETSFSLAKGRWIIS